MDNQIKYRLDLKNYYKEEIKKAKTNIKALKILKKITTQQLDYLDYLEKDRK